MKSLLKPGILLAILSAALAQRGSGAGINVAGVIDDDANGEISQWKTPDATKTLDADGDNIYGTVAHLFYRIEFKGQNTLYTFDGSDTQVGPFPGYSLVDHPDGVSGDTQVRTTTNNGAGMQDDVMFTFTALEGSPANVRIGVVTDGLDGAQFSPSSIGLRQVGGVSSEHPLASVNNTLDMVFFDVTGIVAGDQFEVFGDSGSGSFATHQIVTWDALNPVDIFDPTDTDGDMIGDNWEEFYFVEIDVIDGTVDQEPDGLTDLEEWQHRTNPKNPDTDADGLTDGDEVKIYFTDPLARDSDGDTFDDGEEIRLGTDPNDDGDFPVPPQNLWSVDLQALPGIFANFPVPQVGREPFSGIVSGLWNAFDIIGHDSVATNPSMALADAYGNATPVVFSIFGNISGWSNAPGPDAITNDYFFVNAGNADVSVTWEISGLATLGAYTFYPYGGIARDMLLTVDTNGDGSLDDETPTSVGRMGTTFNVTASAGGTIIGAMGPGLSGEANWGGFQLLLTGGGTIVDTDGDGLSDDLEDDFGTDRFNPDTDGDGQGDGAEVLAAGTDPTDAGSVLRITSIAYVGGDVSLTWTSVPGKTYSVEAGTELTDWDDVATGIAAAPSPAGTTSANVDTPLAGTPRKLYRVRVTAP